MLIYSGSHQAPVLPVSHHNGNNGGSTGNTGTQAPVRYDDAAVTQAVNQMADKADWDGLAQVSLLVQQSDAQQWQRLRASVEQRLHEQMDQHFKADDHGGRGQAIAHIARADSTLARKLYERYEPTLKDENRDDMARGFYRGLGSEGMNAQARSGDGRWLLERTKYNLSDKSDGVSDEEKRYTQYLDDKLSTIHLGDKAPPPVDPSKEPEPERYSDEQARADAIKLYKATKGDGGSFLGMKLPDSGWGTDEDAVFDTLKPRTTEDIAKIRQAYHEEYNRNLDDDLKDEMSGEDLAHVKALLQGGKLEGQGDKAVSRNAESDAVEIHAELHGIFGSKDRVLKVLERAPVEHRQDIANAYAKKYGNGQSGAEAQKFLLHECEHEGHFNPDEITQAKGLLSPDAQPAQPGGMTQGETVAAAGRLHQVLSPNSQHTAYAGRGSVGVPVDADKVLDALRKAGNGDNLQRIGAAYQSQYGQSLEDALKQGLHGDDRDDALQLLHTASAAKTGDKTGDQAQADWNAVDGATRVHKAIDGWGTDEDGLRNALKGKSGEQIQALALAYFDRYASDDQKKATGAERQQAAMDLLRHDLDDDLGGAEQTEILQYLDAPSAKDQAGQLQWQTDHDAARLKLAMDGWGTDEDMIREVLAGKSKPEIDAITASYQKQFGGDLRSRLDDELDGRDTIELLEQDYDVGAVDRSDKRAAASELLLRSQQRLDYEKAGAGDYDDAGFAQHDIDLARQALKDGDLDKALVLADTTGVHVDNLIASKEATTNLMAEGAVLLVTLPVVALSGGTFTPVEAVILGAIGGSLAAGGTYAVMDPQAGGSEVLRHALIGAAEGATAGVPIGKMGQVGKEVVVTGRAAKTARAARAGLAHDAPETVVQAADKQLDKAVRLADRKAKVYQRLQHRGGVGLTLRDSAVWGAGGGAAYGVADAATQHQTWQHGVGDGLLTVLKHGATSSLTGVAMGVPMGMGFHGLMSGGRYCVHTVQRWRSGGAAEGAEAAAASLAPSTSDPDGAPNTAGALRVSGDGERPYAAARPARRRTGDDTTLASEGPGRRAPAKAAKDRPPGGPRRGGRGGSGNGGLGRRRDPRDGDHLRIGVFCGLDRAAHGRSARI